MVEQKHKPKRRWTIRIVLHLGSFLTGLSLALGPCGYSKPFPVKPEYAVVYQCTEKQDCYGQMLTDLAEDNLTQKTARELFPITRKAEKRLFMLSGQKFVDDYISPMDVDIVENGQGLEAYINNQPLTYTKIQEKKFLGMF